MWSDVMYMGCSFNTVSVLTNIMITSFDMHFVCLGVILG